MSTAFQSGLRLLSVFQAALTIGACGVSGSQPKPVPSSAPARPTTDAKPGPSADGLARWDYYFNRNAIAGSVAVGGSFIALAEAGHLLRFDRKTFALTGQLLLAHPASAVCGWQDASVAVGFADGAVSALDSKALTLTPSIQSRDE